MIDAQVVLDPVRGLEHLGPRDVPDREPDDGDDGESGDDASRRGRDALGPGR